MKKEVFKPGKDFPEFCKHCNQWESNHHLNERFCHSEQWHLAVTLHDQFICNNLDNWLTNIGDEVPDIGQFNSKQLSLLNKCVKLGYIGKCVKNWAPPLICKKTFYTLNELF